MMFPFLGPYTFKPPLPRGVLLEIVDGGVPVSSPNPDPFSDQKVTFFTPFFRPGRKNPYPFYWPLRNNVIIT